MTRDEYFALEENVRWELLWDRGRLLFDTADGQGLVFNVDGILVVVEFNSKDEAKRISEFFELQ